jgi:hypothetical protein
MLPMDRREGSDAAATRGTVDECMKDYFGATVGAPGPGLESLLQIPVELLELLELKEGATEQKLISLWTTKQKGAASKTPRPRMYSCTTFAVLGFAYCKLTRDVSACRTAIE